MAIGAENARVRKGRGTHIAAAIAPCAVIGLCGIGAAVYVWSLRAPHYGMVASWRWDWILIESGSAIAWLIAALGLRWQLYGMRFPGRAIAMLLVEGLLLLAMLRGLEKLATIQWPMKWAFGRDRTDLVKLAAEVRSVAGRSWPARTANFAIVDAEWLPAGAVVLYTRREGHGDWGFVWWPEGGVGAEAIIAAESDPKYQRRACVSLGNGWYVLFDRYLYVKFGWS